MSSTPAIPVDYTAKDFKAFRESMLRYAQTAIPEWTTRSAADFGVVLVEMLSYNLDILSYYQDRLIGEAYLPTATQRSSVLDIARVLGYTPYPAAAATGTVTLVSDLSQEEAVTVPEGTQLITTYRDDLQGPLVYETTAKATVPAAQGTVVVPVVEGATQSTGTITVTYADASSQEIPVVELGTSNGLPDQEFLIPRTPVDLSTVRIFGVYPDNPVEWTTTDSLLDATSDERVVELLVDAEGVTTIRFGDDVNGRVPENGIPLMLAYRLGGGARGNLASNILVDVASVVPGVSVLSSSEMTGGWDPEPIESIRRHAPAAWRTQDRAVTAEDYAGLAVGVNGVAKANAVGSTASLITLFILGAQNSVPNADLFEVTLSYVQERAMAGTTVTAQAGTLVPINFGTGSDPVVVGVRPQYRRDDVKLAVTQALQKMLQPESTDFAQRVTVADAYAAIHDIPGLLYSHIPVMARSDQTQTGTQDISCRDWEVPVPGIITSIAVGGV